MNKLGKFLRWIVAGSFTLILSACYGAPVDYDDDSLRVNAHTSNGQPIPNLKLEVSTNNVSVTNLTTDFNGYACLVPAPDLTNTVVITDVDGTNNGGSFSSKTLTVIAGNPVGVTMQ